MGTQAIDVTIDRASCNELTYSITARSGERTSLSPNAVLNVNDTSFNVTLPAMRPILIDAFSGNRVAEGTISFNETAVSNGTYTLKLSLYDMDTSKGVTASSTVTATCRGNETLAVVSATSTSTSASSTSSTQITASSTSISSNSTEALVPSVASSSLSQTPTPTLQPANSTSVFGSHAEETSKGKESRLQLKQGISVGVLAVALLFVVFLGCFLVKRRKRQEKRLQQKENALYRQDWVETASSDNVTELHRG